MSKIYNFNDYDKYFALRINLELWLIIAWFMRPVILLISTKQMGRGPKSDSVGGLKDLVYPDDFGFFLAFVTIIPVVLVIFAYMKRKPDAPDYIRTLWRNCGKLLLLAAALNVVVVFVPFLIDLTYRINLLGWGQLAIAAYIIFYLMTSRRVRDTFADFPADTEADDAKK